MSHDVTYPLSGIRVADFSRVLAGPYATMMLADFGADVIKIESPAGDETRAWLPPVDVDGSSTYFGSVNRNKRSVICDLGTDAGLDQARRLAFSADVVVENFRPGVMKRFGMDAAAVHAEHPATVYCSITGFGAGEGAGLPGYDLLVQAVGGLMSITGSPDGEPSKVGVALVDVLTGQNALAGILLALRARERTGIGDVVEVNLLTSLLAGLVNQASATIATGVPPKRLGNAHPSIAPYRLFHGADRELVIAVGNDRQFAALATVIDPALATDPRFADNPSRVRNGDALTAAIEDRLVAAPASVWVQRLSAVGVPAGPINDIGEAIAFAERLGLDPVVSANGARSIVNPIGLGGGGAAYRTGPPRLGEHAGADWIRQQGKDTPMNLVVDSVFDLDGLLTSGEREWQQRARAFAAERITPVIEEDFENKYFRHELVPLLAEAGFLGMHIEGYGCAGAGAVAYGLVCHELEAADSGWRTFVSVQGSLAMSAIVKHGSEEQKQDWLPRMARGEAIGCFALTEPAGGSDPAAMTTTARREGDDWVIDGAKRWIGLASIADVAVVWAKDEDGVVRGFLVPTSAEGFTATPIDGKFAMRASIQCDIELAGVRIPASAMLPKARGLSAPFQCLNEARYGIVWGAMGAARSCLEVAIERSRTREVFGAPIGSRQLVQGALADMFVEYEKGMLLALHLGRLKERGAITPAQISVGKLNSVREALEIAHRARAILGGDGITDAFPVMRHSANLEAVRTYEGTDEIHQLVLGRELTGIAAFS